VADSGDLPEGWEVAGWEDKDGDWVNAEESGRDPTGDELVDSYQTVVSVRRDDGTVDYYSIMGGVDEWEGLLDAIEDLEDMYG
jgi:hypothetical protein